MFRSLFKRPLHLVGPCVLLVVFLVLLSACAQSVSTPQVSARTVSGSRSPGQTDSRPIIHYAIDHDANNVEWVGIPSGQLSTAQTAWLIFPAALLVDGPVRIPGIWVFFTKDSVRYALYVPIYYLVNTKQNDDKVSPIDPNPAIPGNFSPEVRQLLSQALGTHTDADLAQIPGHNGLVHQTGSPLQNINNLLGGNAVYQSLPSLLALPSGNPNQQRLDQLIGQKKQRCQKLDTSHYDDVYGGLILGPRIYIVQACK